ncbi:MAG: PIN domain-containing protein [Coriobacteriia bacterium]|nr:PIN domain-containing protein [Coriobacteriia bacterium]
MRTNIVLIDFESVQPASLGALEQGPYRVLIFVGARQVKLPFELASAVQRMGERARYIKMSGSGPNALDFHIAFYIGEMATEDPTAFFHIISKDTGFDPLIKHLRARHIFAARSASIEAMPPVKPSLKKSAQERARVIVEALRQPKSTKPRSDKTLARHITTHFKEQQLSEIEVQAVVRALQASGHVRVADGKVTYSLD